MSKRSHPSANPNRDRQRVAQLAAQWMGQSGSRDLRLARQRAAKQLGIEDPSALPDEALLLQALRDYLELFAPAADDGALANKRTAALEAMSFFAPFQPRAVGGVVDGSATSRSAVQLHLHTDEPEALQRFLEDQRIPADLRSSNLRLQAGGRPVPTPCWHLDAGGTDFELVVLPLAALRQPPLSALDGTPMARASCRQLQALLTG